MQPLTDVLAALGALPGDWHAAGCLEMPNLEALARHASSRRIRRSVETGAGKSTLLLSHLSEHHTVFAVNDGESLVRTRDNGLLRRDRVEFIDGPTQLTLMAHQFSEPLQLVFIDGPHGFPFPEMEYWKLYPHLEPGGLLVLDDIHIPTIRHMYDFLVEDHMFKLLETVGKTAFFERTTAPTFSPVEDGWWLQPYNIGRFPVPYDNLGTRAGATDEKTDRSVYRDRLMPLIERWTTDQTRVAVFGTGEHTDRLFELVPELGTVRVVGYLDTSDEAKGRIYRGVPVHHPSWTPGHADVILCSSFAHELTQLALLDHVPVKAVLSHPPSHAMAADDTQSRNAAAA